MSNIENLEEDFRKIVQIPHPDNPCIAFYTWRILSAQEITALANLLYHNSKVLHTAYVTKVLRNNFEKISEARQQIKELLRLNIVWGIQILVIENTNEFATGFSIDEFVKLTIQYKNFSSRFCKYT